MVQVGAGGVVWIIFLSSIISLSFSLSLAIGPILTEILARGYKTFFMLNSIEHEILNADKLKNIKKVGFFYAQIRLECYFSHS